MKARFFLPTHSIMAAICIAAKRGIRIENEQGEWFHLEWCEETACLKVRASNQIACYGQTSNSMLLKVVEPVR